MVILIIWLFVSLFQTFQQHKLPEAVQKHGFLDTSITQKIAIQRHIVQQFYNQTMKTLDIIISLLDFLGSISFCLFNVFCYKKHSVVIEIDIHKWEITELWEQKKLNSRYHLELPRQKHSCEKKTFRLILNLIFHCCSVCMIA